MQSITNYLSQKRYSNVAPRLTKDFDENFRRCHIFFLKKSRICIYIYIFRVTLFSLSPIRGSHCLACVPFSSAFMPSIRKMLSGYYRPPQCQCNLDWQWVTIRRIWTSLTIDSISPTGRNPPQGTVLGNFHMFLITPDEILKGRRTLNCLPLVTWNKSFSPFISDVHWLTKVAVLTYVARVKVRVRQWNWLPVFTFNPGRAPFFIFFKIFLMKQQIVRWWNKKSLQVNRFLNLFIYLFSRSLSCFPSQVAHWIYVYLIFFKSTVPSEPCG